MILVSDNKIITTQEENVSKRTATFNEKLTALQLFLKNNASVKAENPDFIKLGNELEAAAKDLRISVSTLRTYEAGSLLEVVRRYSYETPWYLITVDDDGNPVSVEASERTFVFDLEKATKTLQELGQTTGEWIKRAGAYNAYIAYASVVQLDMNEKSLEELKHRLKVAKGSAEYISTDVNPLSKTQMRQALQSVINSLLGSEDYTVLNCDVNYMNLCTVNKGKGQCKVTVNTKGKFYALIMEVATRVVNGLRYSLDGKTLIKEENKRENPLWNGEFSKENPDEPKATKGKTTKATGKSVKAPKSKEPAKAEKSE